MVEPFGGETDRGMGGDQDAGSAERATGKGKYGARGG
jgi:hypothetical protein